MRRMDTNSTPTSSPTSPDSPAKPAEVKSQARFLVPALILCALVALFWPQEKGREAPGGRVEDTGGGRLELADQYRRVTLVHFWATWCLPCIDEMPKLQKLAKELSGRDDFALVMVAVADDRKKAINFLAGTEGTYFDDGWTVSKAWGSSKLPETHLVVDGQLVYTYVGAQDWDDKAVRARVEEALAGKNKAS